MFKAQCIRPPRCTALHLSITVSASRNHRQNPSQPEPPRGASPRKATLSSDPIRTCAAYGIPALTRRTVSGSHGGARATRNSNQRHRRNNGPAAPRKKRLIVAQSILAAAARFLPAPSVLCAHTALALRSGKSRRASKSLRSDPRDFRQDN